MEPHLEIPLNQAAFCETCQIVVNSLVRCHICDEGNHMHGLAAILNRTETEPVRLVPVKTDIADQWLRIYEALEVTP